jgi:hypothetical protein
MPFAPPSVVRLRQCGRCASQLVGADTKGSTSVSPAIHLKSSVLRVTSVAPCAKAVAAMSESPSLLGHGSNLLMERFRSGGTARSTQAVSQRPQQSHHQTALLVAEENNAPLIPGALRPDNAAFSHHSGSPPVQRSFPQ